MQSRITRNLHPNYDAVNLTLISGQEYRPKPDHPHEKSQTLKIIFEHPIVDGDLDSSTHDGQINLTALTEPNITLAISKLSQRNWFHSLPS